MAGKDKLEIIDEFLLTSGWIKGAFSVSFLAAGEYNANYLVKSEDGPTVLRINHGSQLGLGEKQIAYEYRVLQALSGSGVTPLPIACHPHMEPLGGGALLMGYLPGRALIYQRDLDRAAHIFARVHTVSPARGMVVQADPVADIARESIGLVNRFADHPMERERELLLAYHDTILSLAGKTRALFSGEARCLVNTEVNSANFLISDQGAYLVDWEKAVESYRYQDLAHFMVPTTTLWKTDTILTREEKKYFLLAYKGEACPGMDLDAMIQKTMVMEKTILLRALSWCFMAWYEYTCTDRPMQNKETLAKINQYLSDIPWILNSVT